MRRIPRASSQGLAASEQKHKIKQQPEKPELEIIALGSTKEPRRDEQALALSWPTK
jgi:hypothetical protein